MYIEQNTTAKVGNQKCIEFTLNIKDKSEKI